jgi:hypothetical protein
MLFLSSVHNIADAAHERKASCIAIQREMRMDVKAGSTPCKKSRRVEQGLESGHYW